MTPKERWRAALKRKGLDRLPTDYWGTGEMTGKLLTALGVADEEGIWKALSIDRMHWVGGTLHDPHAATRGGADIWGLRYRDVEHAGGAGSYAEAVNFPLAAATSVADIESYPWPDPGWWTFEGVRASCEAQAVWPVQGGSYEPFYQYCYLRGMERAMEDLVESPEIVEAALDRIFAYSYAVIEGTLKAAGGGVDFVYVAEDFGTQESLLVSRDMFRRFFAPRMRKIIELAHRHGAFAFHHDDGAIRSLIPDLLDCGIDILNPVQWRCRGMDRAGLKAEFGSRLTFHGAMDNQITLPFGTPEEVRREVRENALLLGGGGGYILAPCHNLQVITPVENVIAMYDEVHRL
ncbi:MAG: uroporphyrinogen decarboxylase family protein [Candidatus Coatesbacteria bacterium]